MKVYVAAKFEEKVEARKAMAALEARGHRVTHDWTSEDVTGLSGADLQAYLARCANHDVIGVLSAQAVVVLNHPQLFGGMVETGIALGLGIPVIVVGPEIRDCIFWHLSEIRKVDSVEKALDIIDTL